MTNPTPAANSSHAAAPVVRIPDERLAHHSAIGISSSACFFPEEDDPEGFDGSTVTWTFELPKHTKTAPGLYRIEFIRNLTAEERQQKSATLFAAIEAEMPEGGQQ